MPSLDIGLNNFYFIFNLSPNLQKFVNLLTLVGQFDNCDESSDKMG